MQRFLSIVLFAAGAVLIGLSTPFRQIVGFIGSMISHRPVELEPVMVELQLRLSLLSTLSWFSHLGWLVGVACVCLALMPKLRRVFA